MNTVRDAVSGNRNPEIDSVKWTKNPGFQGGNLEFRELKNAPETEIMVYFKKNLQMSLIGSLFKLFVMTPPLLKPRIS